MQLQSLYYGLLALLIALLIRKLFARVQQYTTARRLGCQPVRKYPHTLPFGYDLFRKRIQQRDAGRRNQHVLELFREHGPTFEENIFGQRILQTSDTLNFQAVGTRFDDFGRLERRSVEPFFGRGILSLHGPPWKEARSIVTPLFKRAELMDVGKFQKFVDRMFALIPRDGKTFDMQPLLQKLFLDSSTEFIFGETVDSLRDPSGQSQEFLNAFNQALAGAGKRMAVPGAAYLYVFDKTWREHYRKVHDFIDERIARRLNSDRKQFLSDRQERYVLVDGMAQAYRDPVELRFQLLNIFFPARDTTAILVSNTLFCLARRPEHWAELRKQALDLEDQPLTFELLKGLSAFRYTLFESLRLYGPSGQIRRRALRDTTLPRGGGPDGSFPVFVPKGTHVIVDNYPKLRDPQIWGADVEAFRPARFEGKVLGWDFTPFFGGPMICPAVNQVISQSVYLLVRLVTEFERIENRDECWEYVERARMLVESANGIKIALYPAKGLIYNQDRL